MLTIELEGECMKNTQNWQLFTFMSVFGKATPCGSEYIHTHPFTFNPRLRRTPTYMLRSLDRSLFVPSHARYARSTARSSSILYPCENTQEYLEICMGGMTFCVCFGMIHVFVMFSRAGGMMNPSTLDDVIWAELGTCSA
jgi:hypothetical protein